MGRHQVGDNTLQYSFFRLCLCNYNTYILLRFCQAILRIKQHHKFVFLDIEKELFQKILIENCKQLPIKSIDDKNQHIIETNVDAGILNRINAKDLLLKETNNQIKEKQELITKYKTEMEFKNKEISEIELSKNKIEAQGFHMI